MTDPSEVHQAPAPPLAGDLAASLLRALLRASAVVLGAAGGVGGLLFGGGVLPMASLVYFAMGIAAALFAGMLALILHGRFLDPRAAAPFARDGRLLAARLQSLLAAAFAVKLGVLVAVVLVLRQLGTKFADSATFAITFAGGALLCQMVTAFVLAQAVQQRGASSAAAATGRGGPHP